MATVRDLVTDALFGIGALGQGDNLSSADAQLALRRLTRMLGVWANENLMIYATTDATVTLATGTASYSTTIWSAGRPVSLESAKVTLNSIDYPVRPMLQTQYNAIPSKSTRGLPEFYFYDPTYPNGTVYFYPTPGAAYVAHMYGRYRLITGAITLETVLSLPDGYEAAIVDNLSVDCAPSFSKTAAHTLIESAKASKAWLKRTNNATPVLDSDFFPSGRKPNILDGF